MNDNLSVFSLIIASGYFVQTVICILVLMSVYSWAIIIAKKIMLRKASANIKFFNKVFKNDDSLENFYNQIDNKIKKISAIKKIFKSGYNEFHRTQRSSKEAIIINSERAYRIMNTTANEEVDELTSSIPALAMIASSSPYIGLFGTVWGIMNSFIGLASVKQATIAVVAPGIAEALIATAFGLFAAIPATIAYNRLMAHAEVINNQYTAFIEKLFVDFQRPDKL